MNKLPKKSLKFNNNNNKLIGNFVINHYSFLKMPINRLKNPHKS